MQKIALFLAFLMLIAVMGCATSMDSTSSQVKVAAASESAAGSQTAAVAAKVAPASSGGYSLQASQPYRQANEPAASQKLNAAPFLTRVETRSAAGASAQVPSPGLTSRADGTMYGPGDQPAAGAGSGMIAPAQSQAIPGKRAVQPAKPR